VQDFWSIIKNTDNRKVNVADLRGYKLIGDGADGMVYQLTHDRCVKIFFNEETQKRELKAIQLGQSSPVIPILYEYGSNYIVMEYIHGTSLSKYLKKHKRLTQSLVEKILHMLDELKRIGFTRHDAEVRHILINESGDLKVVDHKRALSSKRSIPTKLFKGLYGVGLLEEFLNYVQKLRPSYYHEWKNYCK
jgi:predicted Ser/Thr protein kinase